MNSFLLKNHMDNVIGVYSSYENAVDHENRNDRRFGYTPFFTVSEYEPNKKSAKNSWIYYSSKGLRTDIVGWKKLIINYESVKL